MLTDEQIQQIRPRLLTIQVIAVALMMGVLVFAGLMSTIVDWENLNDRLKMLTLFGLIAGVFIFALSIAAPRVFASGANIRGSAESIDEAAVGATTNVLITETLIRFALIEGGIFLNLMVFFIETHIASLVVAGIGLLLMLAFFPRQSSMIAVIQDRLR